MANIKRLKLVLLFLIPIFFLACGKPKPKISGRFWYFWETRFDLDKLFQERLVNDRIDGIFVRMFDVDWNDEIQFPKPNAQLDIIQTLDPRLVGIPVVFIRNRVFENIDSSAIDSFAGRLCHKVESGWKEFAPGRSFHEIQFDCDWTQSTAKSYFRFLQSCNVIFKERKIRTTSTIRLHQVKYFSQTGVPPVDKGILMFYNMGDLKNPNEANSIYSPEIAAKYLNSLNAYPLPLDIALPHFSQAVIYRSGNIAGLIPNPVENWEKINPVRRLGKNNFEAIYDFSASGILVHKGDKIRIEKMDSQGCLESARHLKLFLKNIPINVAIFDLKQNVYETESLAAVFSVFD